MATKALDKQQCLIRLDDTEVEKLAAIQEATGLGKTGAIRKLIRDFDVSNQSRSFVANGQISKNIFLQLPVRNIGLVVFTESWTGMHSQIYFAERLQSEVIVIGYTVCVCTDDNKVTYSMLYSLRGAICRHDNIKFTNRESSMVIPDHGLKQVNECLLQIFIV
jgi:hypothetical protein